MKIKEILKANICAFGQNTFDNFSLEDDTFTRALDSYITANDFEEIIEDYAYDLDYDVEDIDNIVSDLKYKNKDWDYLEIMNCSRIAYSKTITQDKTLDAEALVDNIIKEFNKLNK